MNRPVVSIITPVFNGAAYLDAAVRSVLAQTFADWELLLVDDGSTDDSYQRMLGWSRADRRIKALHHAGHVNRGVSATRNLGLGAARGEYLALLDSDDVWLPAKLARQIPVLEEHEDVGIVYCKASLIGADGAALPRDNEYGFSGTCGNGRPGKSESVFGALLGKEIWMPCSTVVLRAGAVSAAGGFDESLSYQTEDRLLFTLISANSAVFFLDEVLVRYRLHGESFTGSEKWQRSFPEYYRGLYRDCPAGLHPLISAAYRDECIGYIKARHYPRDRGEIAFLARMALEAAWRARMPLTQKAHFAARLIKHLVFS